MTVTTYSTTAKLPYQASFGVMGWLIALNIAHVARSRLLIRILTLPVKPLSYLGSYRRNLNWSHRTDGSLSRNLDA